MIENEMEIKYWACTISNALVRNVNDSFASVSFEISEDRKVIVKVILEKWSEKEESLINQLMDDYIAMQLNSYFSECIVEVGEKNMHLKYLVYQKNE